MDTIELLEQQVEKLEKEFKKSSLPWFVHSQVIKQKEIMTLRFAIRKLKEIKA